MSTPKYPVTVQLSGQGGNAFAVMGKVRKAIRSHLREQGASSTEIDTALEAYTNEATSGDYNNLLRVSMETVEVQ